MERRAFRVSDIKVLPGRRAIDPQSVADLVESITTVGLLQPLAVRADGTLILGAHRLAAVRHLGWAEVECQVYEATDLDAELMEIDENLLHKELSYAERVTQLARRKAIYQAKYPETKAGGDRTSGSLLGPNVHSEHLVQANRPSFAEDTARKTRQGRGTVDRDLRIGTTFTRSELDRLMTAKIPKLALDMLVALRRQEPEPVRALLTKSAKEMRECARGLVPGGFQTRRRESMEAKPLGRAAAKKANAALRDRSESRDVPRRPTTPTCQTEKYSQLGAHDEKAAARTVLLTSNPATAAAALADHFDREGMEALLYYLLRYLSPKSVAYVVRTYGKETTDGNTLRPSQPLA